MTAASPPPPSPAEQAHARARPGEQWIPWYKLLRDPPPQVRQPPGAPPFDTWPSAADVAAMREFEAYVDELIDRQEWAPELELEAAE